MDVLGLLFAALVTFGLTMAFAVLGGFLRIMAPLQDFYRWTIIIGGSSSAVLLILAIAAWLT